MRRVQQCVCGHGPVCGHTRKGGLRLVHRPRERRADCIYRPGPPVGGDCPLGNRLGGVRAHRIGEWPTCPNIPRQHHFSAATAPPLDTVTAITQSPAEVRRERPFTVGGTVYTVTGHTVDGMTVEIYVNETKEHGGTKIGTATTRFGRWSAEVSLPRDMERGPYQLLAHAVANDRISRNPGATRTSLSSPAPASS